MSLNDTTDSEDFSEESSEEENNDSDEIKNEIHFFAFEREPSDVPFEHLLTTNTCPTQHENASVDNQKGDIEKNIELIEAEVDDLKAKLQAVREKLLNQERRHRAYSRIQAPIRKLPQDVLQEIFLHLNAHSTGFPLSVSLVCSSWRNVILETPQLWTTVTITQKTIHHCRTLFERSGNNLPLTFIGKDWKKHKSQSTKWLVDYIPRIERFSVSATSCIPPYIASLPASSWVNLRDLNLQMTSKAWETIGGKLWRPEGVPPPLTRLRLAEMGLPPSNYPLPVNTLTHVEIVDADPKIDITALMTFLRACGKLESFKIQNSAIWGHSEFDNLAEIPDGVPNAEKLIISNLKELSTDFGTATVCFLNRLTLPALLHLTLRGAIRWERAFKALANRSSFHLKHFSMESCRPNDPYAQRRQSLRTSNSDKNLQQEQALTVLKSSPTIETLHVFDSMPVRSHLIKALRYDPGNQQDLLGPNLKHLWVYDDIPLTESSILSQASSGEICSMLESRRPVFQPASVMQNRDTLMVCCSGQPSIPVLSMKEGEFFRKFQNRRCSISVHIFF